MQQRVSYTAEIWKILCHGHSQTVTQKLLSTRKFMTFTSNKWYTSNVATIL